MAEHIVVAVFDRSAAVYGRPFFVAARGLAIRSFIDEVNRGAEGNVMYDHPEDFSLYVIGTYFDGTAELVSQNPECLITGAAAADMRK